MKPSFIMVAAGVLLAATGIVLALYVIADRHSTAAAAAASSVMLQAMERGYQCHAAGRSLEDCQQEQRQRWANPVDLPPFGSRP